MKKFLLFILLMAAAVSSFAQTGSVRGSLKDENKVPLGFATVVLLHPADSTLAYYCISDEKGYFEMKEVRAGRFLLQSSLMGHNTVYLPVVVISGQGSTADIIMPTSPVALKEVIVSDEHVPMRFRRDTIEFNTAAFPTHPGAVAEDVIKKLPGIEVDRAGNIKALGEDIKKVLVDGREFFGNDLKLATRNVPADALRKIQVFDKKSDESEFTGIDDGRREKTLNLLLKEEKKNAIFGELLGGAGMNDHYQGNAKVYRFTPQNQFAALGMLNNINQYGFSFKDYIDFSGGIQNMTGHGGQIRITVPGGGGSDFPVNFGQPVTGLASSGAAGLNFSHSFRKDSRYFASIVADGSDKTLIQNTLSRNFANNNIFNQTDSLDDRSSGRSVRLNIGLKNRIDSTRNLVINGNGLYSYGKTLSKSSSSIFDAGSVINNMNGNRDENADRLSGNISGSYVKLLNRGKTVYKIGSDISYSADLGNDSWFTSTIYSGTPQTAINSLRRKDNNKSFNFDLNSSLTVKIKKSYLEPAIEAGRRVESLNRSMGQISDFFIPSDTLSPFFRSGYSWLRPALRFIHNTEKIQFTLALQGEAGRMFTTLNGSEKTGPEKIWFTPELSWEYEYRTGRRLRAYYRSDINVPSAGQLLPVTDYYNPLLLTSGNRDLKPEFSHSLSLNWWVFDQFSFTSLLTDLRAAYTSNKINWARNVGGNYLQSMKLINVPDDYRLGASASFSTPLRFAGIKVNADIDESWNKGINFVNNIENTNTNFVHKLSLSFDNRNKNKFDITAGASLQITDARFSVNTTLNNVYRELAYFTDLSYTPGKRWNFTLNADLTSYSAGGPYKSQTIPLTGFSMSYFFLKDLRGGITLQCSDMLNRNTGISRYSEFNYLKEQRSNMIGRLIMLSFKYRLNKSIGQPGSVDVKINKR